MPMWLKRLVYRVDPHAVLVLGNQKSGTSAIAHLLASACSLSRTVDIPELWPPTFEDVLMGRADLRGLARKHPKRFSRQLVKEPYLTFLVPQARELWPEARFAFVIRDPRDNIRSILNRLGIPGNLDHFVPQESDIPPAWRPLFEPRLWGFEEEHYIEILAARWVQAAHVYLANQNRMELLRYEDFLRDKTGTIYALARRLGLSSHIDISSQVDVPFQPPGEDRDMRWSDFFGDRNLRRITEICGETANRFGYAGGGTGARSA